MKIARFKFKKNVCWGIIESNNINLLQTGPWTKIKRSGRIVPLNKVRLLSPFVSGKIILAGLNYKDHARELKMDIPDEPVIFLKPATAVIGPGCAINYPPGVNQLDYEAELALIIGKKAKNINKKNARRYIMGYTCLNDITARDLQKKDGQWTRSKSFDTFCPVGPWIETELNPDKVKIQSYVNGCLKQDSHTSNLIFSAADLISFISRIMTLFPGDIISTGTPAGIGPIKQGDKVEIFIEGIGRLTNFVR